MSLGRTEFLRHVSLNLFVFQIGIKSFSSLKSRSKGQLVEIILVSLTAVCVFFPSSEVARSRRADHNDRNRMIFVLNCFVLFDLLSL